MLGWVPVQEVMRVASADRGVGHREVLLVADSADQLDTLSGLIGDLRVQPDLMVRTCYTARLARPTDLWGQSTDDERPHRLAGWRTTSGWRRAITSIVAPLTPRRRRVRWAVSLDPWFRRSVRSASDVVVLGHDSDLVNPLVHHFAPGTTVHDGPDGLSRLVHDIARRGLETALHTAQGNGSRTRWDEASLDATVMALGAARVLPGEDLSPFRDELLSLPSLTRDPAQVRRLVGAARTLLPEPSADPALNAYLARADLDERGTTAADPARVAADLLTSTWPLIREAEDLSHAVTRTTLALEVLFHRELHSDSVDSPLITDPTTYLEPVRSTTVWQLLTRAVPCGTGVGTRAAGADAPDTGPRPPDRCRVQLLPGSYGTFLQPVAEALKVSPAVDVTAVRRKDLRPHLRTMGVTPDVVERRLAAALGRPFSGYPELVDLLAVRSSDVVVFDWADKSAVLGTLLVPSDVRVVVRVHGVDVLRPWVHLLDWSRVEAVVCVAPALREVLVDVVGERLLDLPIHVVPNLVDLKGLGRVATRPRDPRTLGVVGWAQKVKDPLWAVEVLAALRKDGTDWRLLLIGADFAEGGPASGTAYATAFRERVLQDDVREHIEYTGFVDDLPPVLSRCGFVLSSSLRESWPVGLAEGVAAGAVPVVRDWPMLASRNGARSLYGNAVVDGVEEAVDRIRSMVEAEDRSRAAHDARQALAEIADPEGTTSRLREIVLGAVGRLADLSATGQHEEAMSVVRAILEEPRPDPTLLSQAAVSAARAGEPTLRLEVLRRWASYGNERVGQLMRQQEGRLRELTPGWLPTVATSPDRVTPVDEGARRVLHVLKASLPQRRSGYTMRSAYLLGEQAKAGIDVVAVTALDYPLVEDSDATQEGHRGPREEIVGGVRHRRLLRSAIPRPDYPDDYLDSFASALVEVVSQERPSVIHAHSGHRGYDLALVALAVGRATGVPVVYEVRGFFEALWTSDLDRAEASELYRLRRRIETWCMQQAAAVTTLSESMRDDILARPGIDPSTVFVVPNGVDPQALTPRARRADLVAQLGLGDAFTFGYVSNLDHPREGQELLVQAVRSLRDQGLDAKALVVGGGVRAQVLEDLARQLDIEEHVIFTGYVDHAEVGDYYALLDVFVVPRIDERAARLVTPIKPYEAMAMHLPVVVSDLPALLEIVGGGTRGRAFAAGDPEDLAGVLRQLAHDPALREQLADAGRRWVLERRTWRAAAARYDAVYDMAMTAPTTIAEEDR